ncbi:hypothetical protein N9164_15185, partial [Draconibacterium sp.]|nr:hypothetical protein [Draconibacterium sp.]
YFNATNFDATLSDEIKSTWYYKLAPGKSMTRAISLSGYDSLPTGEVSASFHFPGSYNLKEGEWKKSDGRIWIGIFRVEKELNLR